MRRSVSSLMEWNEKLQAKKQYLRDVSADEEREKLKLSTKKLICPGSANINKYNQRESLVRQSGMSITDWLHLQAYDQRRKRQNDLKRTTLLEKQRMRPELTQKARNAKP